MTLKIQKHQNYQIIEFQWSSDQPNIPISLPCSCFLVDGLLIDSGAPAGASELYNALSQLPANESVRACYITHCHEDHAGGAYLLKEKLGIPIYANPQTIPIIEKGFNYRFYRQVYWGATGLHPISAELCPSPLHSPGGKFLFELFPMPGHAPDLVAVIEPKQQWVFVADAVLNHYTTLFGNTSPDIHENIAVIRDSHDKLLKYTEGMDHLQIYSTHRGIFSRQFLMERVVEIDSMHKNAHQIRDSFITQGISDEKKLYRKIIRQMFGDESPAASFTEGELSRENLIRSLLEWPL